MRWSLMHCRKKTCDNCNGKAALSATRRKVERLVIAQVFVRHRSDVNPIRPWVTHLYVLHGLVGERLALAS